MERIERNWCIVIGILFFVLIVGYGVISYLADSGGLL